MHVTDSFCLKETSLKELWPYQFNSPSLSSPQVTQVCHHTCTVNYGFDLLIVSAAQGSCKPSLPVQLKWFYSCCIPLKPAMCTTISTFVNFTRLFRRPKRMPLLYFLTFGVQEPFVILKLCPNSWGFMQNLVLIFIVWDLLCSLLNPQFETAMCV